MWTVKLVGAKRKAALKVANDVEGDLGVKREWSLSGAEVPSPSSDILLILWHELKNQIFWTYFCKCRFIGQVQRCRNQEDLAFSRVSLPSFYAKFCFWNLVDIRPSCAGAGERRSSFFPRPPSVPHFPPEDPIFPPEEVSSGEWDHLRAHQSPRRHSQVKFT